MSRLNFPTKIDRASMGVALRAWLAAEPGMTRARLAELADVDVSVVSRAATGDFRNLSKGIKRVFIHANIDPDTYRVRCDPSSNQHLMSALHGVWNGTPRHARALASVIRSLNRLT